MTQNPMEPESGELAAGQSLADLLAKPAFTLTKAALADMLFERVGLNKREAKDMVETFFEEISAALIRGESVKLSGFGNFQLRDKQQRPGRNPKTGEEIPISARRVVTFHELVSPPGTPAAIIATSLPSRIVIALPISNL